MLSKSLHWSDEDFGKSSQIFTCLEVLLSGVVSLESADVSGDLLLVEKEVLGDGGNEVCLVCEDASPGLDGGQVVLHVLARVELLRDLEADEEELQAALDDVVPAAGLEVLNGLSQLVVHLGAALVARLNLRQVIVRGHSVDEASQDVVDHVKVHGLAVVIDLRNLDWGFAKKQDRDVSEVLARLEVVAGFHVTSHIRD